MKSKVQTFWYVFLLFFSLAGLAAGLRIFLFRIPGISMLTYGIQTDPECFSALWCLLAGLPALLFLSLIHI